MMIHRDWSDDEDADLMALRQAALRTLPNHKRRLSSRSSESDSFTSSETHDKDYRFENQTSRLTTTHDIDERFPADQDLLIVNCPNQFDDELFFSNAHRKNDEKKQKIIEDEDHRSISTTMKSNGKDFDLRQLIKKRSIDETSIPQRKILLQNQRSCRHSIRDLGSEVHASIGSRHNMDTRK